MLLCILSNCERSRCRQTSLDLISNFQAGLDEIRNSLDDGRVLVRYSGTESKIRLLAEGRTQLLANHTLDSFGPRAQTLKFN